MCVRVHVFVFVCVYLVEGGGAPVNSCHLFRVSLQEEGRSLGIAHLYTADHHNHACSLLLS